MEIGAVLSNRNSIEGKRLQSKYRLVKVQNTVTHKTFFHVQKKCHILFFSWWKTVKSDYTNLHVARHEALGFIANQKHSIIENYWDI